MKGRVAKVVSKTLSETLVASSAMVPPPIRTTWELSPEWVQQLGKHHSVALRDAIIALKRDDSAFVRTICIFHNVVFDTTVHLVSYILE